MPRGAKPSPKQVAKAREAHAKRKETIKKVVGKVKQTVKNIITGDTKYQTKPPKGYSYLRGRLVKTANKKK